MKFALSIFTTLVIIIGALLFVQYQVYSNEDSTHIDDFSYTQEIEVVYRENSLDIRHHFKNLPDQEIALTIPTRAQSVECFLESSSSCERLDEIGFVFKKGHVHAQSISYVIPVEGGLSQDVLLSNIFAELLDGEVTYTTLHISTDNTVTGQWITGLPLIGQQQLKLVNYVMFSGEGYIKDLYYASNGAIAQEISEYLTIYSNTPVTGAFKDTINKMGNLVDEHFTIVQSSQVRSNYRMLFLPEITEASVQKNMTLSQIEMLYQFEAQGNEWLKHIMASFLTGTPFGNEKVQTIVGKIKQQMSEAQLVVWLAELKQLEGKKITPKLLDEKLSKVLESSTNFITKNSEVAFVYPFYYIDNRDIMFNSKDVDNIEIIYYEGRMLYKAQSLFELLGYNAYEGENGYYVNNETRVFRFPNEPGFYVFNQRRYNTSVKPIIKLQNEYFIEESWLQRLFLVDLTKTDSSINIKTTETQTE